jgi:hypothetical protein
MPFNSLCLACLSPKTNFTESGGHVSIRKQSDECVLFFVVDPSSNRVSTAREDLTINGKICDLVVYYRKDDKSVICLVETKGSNVARAVQQVKNTYDHLKRALNQATQGRACRTLFEDIVWKAYVCLHGSSPRDIRNHRTTLNGYFGQRNCDIKRHQAFGDFLRR